MCLRLEIDVHRKPHQARRRGRHTPIRRAIILRGYAYAYVDVRVSQRLRAGNSGFNVTKPTGLLVGERPQKDVEIARFAGEQRFHEAADASTPLAGRHTSFRLSAWVTARLIARAAIHRKPCPYDGRSDYGAKRPAGITPKVESVCNRF